MENLLNKIRLKILFVHLLSHELSLAHPSQRAFSVLVRIARRIGHPNEATLLLAARLCYYE